MAQNADGSTFDEADPEAAAGEDSMESGGADATQKDLWEEERFGKTVPLEGAPLEPFFKAVDEMTESGTGLVRILHYGDSHTAAGFLPGAIRKALQERFGDGGHGFVLLGRPWPSYRAPGMALTATGSWATRRILFGEDPVKLDGRYGLCGVAVESAEKGASTSFMSRRKKKNDEEQTDKVELFYLKQKGGGSFSVRVGNKLRSTVDTSSNHLETGFYTLELAEGERGVEIILKGNGRVRLFGAVMENSGPGIVYDTLGINGAFFFTPLRWDESLLSEQVARRQPSLIVTMYGTNDANSRSLTALLYERKVKKVLKRLRAGTPETACLMLGPMDRAVPVEFPHVADNLDQIIEIQKRAAEEEGCSFVDLRQLMGGTGSHSRWISRGLAQPDGVHLTVSGYKKLGGMIADKLLEAYDIYRREMTNVDASKTEELTDEPSAEPLN